MPMDRGAWIFASPYSAAHHQSQSGHRPAGEEDEIDLRDLCDPLRRDLPLSLGLTLIGLAVGALALGLNLGQNACWQKILRPVR